MKRLIALILCLCFVLGGCAQNTQHTEEGDGVMPAPNQAEQPAAASFEQLALRLAALPNLPQEPDETAFWDKLNALDYNKLGEEKYNEEYQSSGTRSVRSRTPTTRRYSPCAATAWTTR